MTSYIFVIDTF